MVLSQMKHFSVPYVLHFSNMTELARVSFLKHNFPYISNRLLLFTDFSLLFYWSHLSLLFPSLLPNLFLYSNFL